MAWIEREGRTVEEARAAAVAALGLPEADIEVEVLREGAKGLFGLGGESALVRVRPATEARDFLSAFYDRPPVAGAPAEAAPSRPDVDPPPARDVAFFRDPIPAAPVPEVDAVERADDVREDAVVAVAPSERQQLAVEVGTTMLRGILERMGLQGEVSSRTQGSTVYLEVSGDDMGILIGRGGKTLEALQELIRAGVQRHVKARTSLIVDVEAYWGRRRDRGRRGGKGESRRSS